MIEPEYSAEELSSDYDENNAVMISLEQNQISCDSQKISVSGSVITILKSGTYVLQGELEDGSIVVDIDDDIVRLVFAGVDITSKSSAPVYVKEAKETIITLKENTTNTISDAAEYVLENEEDNEPNAAIFSKDDLAINGSGTLKIQANYNHGIQGKDDVVLISGKIEIDSVGDAIVGKDSVVIKESDITIESEASGIKGTNSEGGKGYVYLDNPTIAITSKDDGIHANTVVQMDGGNGALDYATECQVNGGVLVAAGSLGMEMAPDSNSQVPCVNIAFENTYDGGTEITIQKESGEEVISYTPSKSFSSFVLSHDGLEKGSNYVIYANGTEVESFTVSDTITTVGNTSQMGMGTDMGRGGQR